MLADMINKLKKSQIARATHRGERWYIINIEGSGIHYYDFENKIIGDLVVLDVTDILAHYDLL